MCPCVRGSVCLSIHMFERLSVCKGVGCMCPNKVYVCEHVCESISGWVSLCLLVVPLFLVCVSASVYYCAELCTIRVSPAECGPMQVCASVSGDTSL